MRNVTVVRPHGHQIPELHELALRERERSATLDPSAVPDLGWPRMGDGLPPDPTGEGVKT